MSKLEYHHYVPRFILKRFNEPSLNAANEHRLTTSTSRNRKQRKQEAWKTANRKKAKKRGGPDLAIESIKVFNMASHSIEQVEIRRAFGLYNFYKDFQCTENMRHLEDKLAKLESQVAPIIERLHVATTQPGNLQFTLPRRELQILRRFIFIMHYRSHSVDESYFKEDHPDNLPVRNWIRKLKEEEGYRTDRDIWLRGLQYYLDTDHSIILSHAKSLQSGSPGLFIPHAELDANTPPEHWFALAYETSINNYYLGIWAADEESEFILGHNSYGLWEGTINGNVPQLFRIYVMSPTITLVLKQNISKSPLFRAMEDSTLGGLPLRPATTEYHRPPFHLRDPFSGARQRHLALQDHLKSAHSREDRFTFDINRLSKDQTYLVNQVVLENLRAEGLLAFKSGDAMLDTARRYDTPEGPFRKKNRRAIAALAVCLGSPSSGSTSLPVSHIETGGPIVEQLTGRPDLLLSEEVKGRMCWGVSEFDSAFDDMLVDVLEGSIEFQSDYDRARYIHALLPHPNFTAHPFITRVHAALARMSRYVKVMQAGLGLRDLPPTLPKYELVGSLREDDSTYLLGLLASHMETWERDWHLTEQESQDRASKILGQVTAVTYLGLLVHNDPRLATRFCGSVTFMRPITPYQSVLANRQPTAVRSETPVCEVGVEQECSPPYVERKGAENALPEAFFPGPLGFPQTNISEGRAHTALPPRAFIEETQDSPSEKGTRANALRDETAPHDSFNNGDGHVERMSVVPRKRLILQIPWLFLTTVVHLGAGVLTLALELAIGIWRSVTGQPPRDPVTSERPGEAIFPSYVGHFFMAAVGLYSALYMTAALLFGLPVYES